MAVREGGEMKEYTEKRIKMIYNQDMNPCPVCGSWHFIAQTPIQLELDADDIENPRKAIGKWVAAHKDGPPMLKGPCFFMCFDCGHKGPAVDCSGRTSEEVGQDPVVWKEMKRLWNEQAPNVAPMA